MINYLFSRHGHGSVRGCSCCSSVGYVAVAHLIKMKYSVNFCGHCWLIAFENGADSTARKFNENLISLLNHLTNASNVIEFYFLLFYRIAYFVLHVGCPSQ